MESTAVDRTDADRRLGIRVIAFVLTLCVFVIGWAAFRAFESDASAADTGRGKPARHPAPDPARPQLVQVIPDSFTIPGTVPKIPWPSVGQAAVEIEGVGSLGTSGRIGTPVPIASVTKTMTAYLILSDHPLAEGAAGPAITVSTAEAATYKSELAEGQSVVRVQAGERISERDALEALMLASADNVAKILARWDAGSVSRFVAAMNSTARRLGMTHTVYTDPSGLDPATVSTASDQIKLAEAAMRLPSFRAIVALRMADVPLEGTIANFNHLLGKGGVIGIKTGSTDSAGGCLLFAAETTVGGQTMTVIGAVLGQPLGDGDGFLGQTLAAAWKIIDAARHTMAAATIADPGAQVASVRWSGASSERRLGVASAVTVIGRPGQTYRVLVTGDPSAATLEATPLDGAPPSSSAATATSQLIPLCTRGAIAAD